MLLKISSRKNEGVEPKQKQYPVVDVTGDRSKFGCYKDLYCWEPAREIPPTTRSCGGDLTSKADQDSRDSLDLLEHLPQTKICLLYTILRLSPTLLTLTGGYP